MIKKENILLELDKNIPDFNLLFSDKGLELMPSILNELLKIEKLDFQNKLKTNDSGIDFNLFYDDSKLDILYSLLNHLKNVYGTNKIKTIIDDFEPKYIDFANDISYSKRYYDMLIICLKKGKLNNEQTKIISDAIKSYKVRGIALDESKQKELKIISQQNSELSRKFSSNELDSEGKFSYFIKDNRSIKELPEDILEITSSRAIKQNKQGYVFESSMGEYSAIMKYCNNAEIRKYFYEQKSSIASSGQYDNRQIIIDLLNNRDKEAKILGFKNYVELSMYFKMAKSGEEVINLLNQISTRAKVKAKEELVELEEYFNITKIEAWDTAYYFRKYKEEKFNINDKEIKKYLEFETVLSGLFKIANKLYGIELKEIKNNFSDKNNETSFLNDTKLYEIYQNGNKIAIFMLDPFFRKEKRSGAWANVLISKNLKNKLPFIVNCCNFNKSKNNTLLTMGDVETLFHEFGHAMHEMSSKSIYSELSGFNIERDFVEVPSQFNEHFCRHKDGLKLFAKHYISGEIIPDELIDKLDRVDKIGIGNFTLAQNSYAYLDLALHSGKAPDTIDDLDTKVLGIINSMSIIKKDKNYKMYTSFSHIFDGGYSAGYYSYLWAEIIELDIWKKFKEEGIFNKKISKNFFDKILSKGSTKKASDLFKDFMGRDVSLDGFLNEKGI